MLQIGPDRHRPALAHLLLEVFARPTNAGLIQIVIETHGSLVLRGIVPIEAPDEGRVRLIALEVPAPGPGVGPHESYAALLTLLAVVCQAIDGVTGYGLLLKGTSLRGQVSDSLIGQFHLEAGSVVEGVLKTLLKTG